MYYYRLQALILINILLTGPPLLLFLLYTLTILLFSFSTALITTFTLASLFTASMVGVALLVIVPTVCVTTAVAMTLFGWGMLGYWVFDRIKKRENGGQLLQGWREQNKQGFPTQAKAQQTSYGAAVNDYQNKNIQPGWGFSGSEDRDNVDIRGELSDTKKQDDDSKWEAEQGTHESRKNKFDQRRESNKVDNESTYRSARTYNNAGQAEYKATIADDGAYIEVAPGLDTVHSIAVSNG